MFACAKEKYWNWYRLEALSLFSGTFLGCSNTMLYGKIFSRFLEN